jgi:hypothetical protein
MFRHVSQRGQTLGNISEKHRETSNVSEFARKHFCFSGSKFCFRNNVSTGGQKNIDPVNKFIDDIFTFVYDRSSNFEMNLRTSLRSSRPTSEFGNVKQCTVCISNNI